MSFLESIGSFPSKMEWAIRAKTLNKRRNFFSVWKRAASDSLREKLMTQLGYESVSGDAYQTFLSIPEVGPDAPLETYVRYRTAAALFSKDEDMRSPIDKRQVAYESFVASERTCRSINEAFRDGRFAIGDVARILFYAQRKIATILGDCPGIDELDLQFGSGASTSCSKQKVSARWKLSAKPSISKSAVGSLQDLFSALPRYFQFHKGLEVHNGKLDFVPKNYKTMRSICIEPTVNGMVQRGIGTVMKQKMLLSGIDLYDQSLNRRRAAQGSVSGHLGTIDLEKASDSVSYMLVMELLPWEWFHLLDTYRTPIVEFEGVPISLEKFSSMGNGYTFELESLIFYSLAYGLAKTFEIPFDLTVYGDDIVANTQLCQAINAWFPHFGFSVNNLKSYWEGPFRESCGGDFVNGVNVRPFYLKGRFSYHKVFCFYNFLVRNEIFDRSGSLRTLLLSFIPVEMRLYGPDGYGDGHLITDDCRPHLLPYGRKKGYGGYLFPTFVAKPKRLLSDCLGDALLPAYFASTIRSSDVFRRSHLRKKIGSTTYVRTAVNRASVRSFAPDHFSVRRKKDDEMSSKLAYIYVLDLP